MNQTEKLQQAKENLDYAIAELRSAKASADVLKEYTDNLATVVKKLANLKPVTVTLQCNECGAKRKVSPHTSNTDCRKCGGAGMEVA